MNNSTIQVLQDDYQELLEHIDKVSANIVRTEERLVAQRKEVSRLRGDFTAIKRVLKAHEALPETETDE